MRSSPIPLVLCLAVGALVWCCLGHNRAQQPVLSALLESSEVATSAEPVALGLIDALSTGDTASVERQVIAVEPEVQNSESRAEQGPLIVAGRVVDTEGVGIAAEVQLLQGQPTGQVGSHTWVRLTTYHRRCTVSGSFELRGPLPPGPYALAICAEDHLDQGHVQFPLGEGDLQIVLYGSGSMSGRVLLPAGIESHSIVLTAGLMTGGPLRGLHYDRPIDHRGHFQLEELHAGTHWLELRLFGQRRPLKPWMSGFRQGFPGDREPLIRIEGLEVPHGGRCQDPRLLGIKLPTTVRTLELTILGQGGELVPDGFVLTLDPDEEDWPDQGVAIRNGRAKVLVQDLPLSLYVAAKGYRPATILEVQSPTTVELQPGIRLHCELAEEVPGLPPGDTLFLSLKPSDHRLWGRAADKSLPGEICVSSPERHRSWLNNYGQPSLTIDSGDRIGLDRSFDLIVPGPGDYQLVWTYQTYDHANPIHGRAAVRLESAPGAHTLTVLEDPTTQYFVVSPPDAPYSEAIARLPR